MGRTNQRCSLCSAPETVRAFIEAQVKARRKLKELEIETGFDDSIISRHMRKCVPQREAREHRDLRRKINTAGRRFITAWPEGTYSLQADEHNPRNAGKTIHPSEITDHDLVINVEFDTPMLPRLYKPEPAPESSEATDLPDSLA